MSNTPGGNGEKPGGADYRVLAIASIAVGELVAPILIGLWLDNRFGWSPFGLAAGAVIGFVGSLAHLMLIAGRQSNR